jgi:hypothetical protein
MRHLCICVEFPNFSVYHDDWLTVHRSITLVDLQLDAQNSCLFTYNTFIKILYMFRAHLQEVYFVTIYIYIYIYAASGIVTLCR